MSIPAIETRVSMALNIDLNHILSSNGFKRFSHDVKLATD